MATKPRQPARASGVDVSNDAHRRATARQHPTTTKPFPDRAYDAAHPQTAGPWGNPDDANYAQSNIVSINVDGLSFQVNKNVVTQFSGLIHDLVQAGYHPKQVQGYNNRDITGGSGKSNHAYGAAIDIDPGDNPRYVGKDGKHTIDSALARSLSEKWGLGWGGDYKSSKDYMHFEAKGAPRSVGSPKGGSAPVITPAAQAAGATAGTVVSGPAAGAGGTAAAAAPAAAAGSATAPTSLTLPKNASDKQISDFIASKYGYLAGFLHDPEIKKVLYDAAKGGWGENEMLGALQKTKYWKTTSAQARTWDSQTKLDNATQHQNVVNQQAAYEKLAQKLGITINPFDLHTLTVTSMRLGWTPEQVEASLRAHGKVSPLSDTARTFDQQTKDDPSTQNQNIANTVASLTATAHKRGLTLDPQVAHDLAVKSLREGWTSEQLDEALKSGGKLDPTTSKTAVGQLRAQAEGDYLVKLSNPVLDQWAADISSGKLTADDYTNYLKEQAKSLFPSLSNAIDRGITVNRYIDPYRQQAASLLEINPDSIDFVNDPKFSKALFNTDGKTGERTQMSLSDWQNYLRSTPDYQKTAGAIDQGAQFATMLTKTFGKVA